MKALYRRLLFALLLLGIIVVLRFSGLGSYIHLEYIRENSEYLKMVVEQHYVFSLMIFWALYVIIILCYLPVTAVLNCAGGYFFGVILGALYSIIGATMGATLSFLLFRYLLRNSMQKRYGSKLQAFNQEFKQRGASYLLFLQLLPITPFGFITIISGLSPISWLTFAWTTMVGIAPGSFIYAFAGQRLMMIEKTSDILSWPLMLSLLLLAGLSLAPVLMRYKQDIHD